MCFGGSSYDPNQDTHPAPYAPENSGGAVQSTLTKQAPLDFSTPAPTTPKMDLTNGSNPGLNTKGLM